MILVSSGIDRVRAFALAGGIRADGSVINEPRSVLVKWRSQHEDKLYHVYVNGEFAGVTANCQQRMMAVAIQSCWASAARIEVYAVEPGQANVDFSDEVDSAGQMDRVRIGWLRFLSLPFEGEAEIFSNGGSGDVDYETPVTARSLRLWPTWQDKSGFGLSRFGMSDLGFDSSAAVGFGVGMFGDGEFGFDADEISWTTDELETGLYKFAVKVTDKFGNNNDNENESEQVVVIREAQPGEKLEIDSYDNAQNKLVLNIS